MDSISDAPKFNYFSLAGLFWVQFREELISFSVPGLPKDIHFTFSFPNSKPYINFHITKNTEDARNKPKIEIFRVDKSDLDDLSVFLSNNLLRVMLKPVNMEQLKTKHGGNIGYIPKECFEESENSDSIELQNQLSESIREFVEVKRKKTRVKLKKGFEKGLEKFGTSNETIGKIEKFITAVPECSEHEITGGMAIAGEEVLNLIHWQGQWHTLNLDLKPYDLFRLVVGDDLLASVLSWKVKRAIVILSKSKSYKDTKQHSEPIKIILKKRT